MNKRKLPWPKALILSAVTCFCLSTAEVRAVDFSFSAIKGIVFEVGNLPLIFWGGVTILALLVGLFILAESDSDP